MAGSELQTDLSIAPYFDDYDEDKQYYRILFRPSFAVQARELTQIQTILQRQITRFGNSIYKDGSIVEGCNFSTYPRLPQMKFKDSNTSTLDFTTLTLNSSEVSNSVLLVSNTTGVRAVIFKAFTGAESVVNQGSLDTNRAYLQYIKTGSSGGNDVNTFLDTEEQIDVYSTNQNKLEPLNPANYLGKVYTLSSNSSVNAYGLGYGMKVGTGIIYQKGFFQKTLPQAFMIREHGANAAGIKVGFTTDEYVITEITDTSLNDNAIGSYNYTAPGAHRLKLVPVPISYDASNNAVTIPKNFLSVLEFDGGDGRIVQNKTDMQLSAIGDVIARRTFEGHGDFIVKPFSIDVIAHEANTRAFYYNTGAGIAYVDGYRVELLSPRRVYAKRGIDTEDALGQLATINMGNFARVQNFTGTIPVENIPEVMLINGDQEVLGNNLPITNPIGGLSATWVGNANIRAVVFESGSGLKGTPNAQFQLYLTNIRMKPGKNFLNDADSFYMDDATYGRAFGDFIKNDAGSIILYDTQLQNLLFSTGRNGLKRLTSNTGVNDTAFVYRKTITTNGGISLTSPGQVQATFTLTGSDEFNYGVGYLSDVNSEIPNIMFKQDTVSNPIITNASKAGDNSVGANLTSTTAFANGWYPGTYLKLTNTSTSATGYVTVRNINNSNSVYVTPKSQIPPGLLEVRQFWKQGTQVNFTGSGNTMYVGATNSLTVNLALDPSSLAYDFYAQIPIRRNTANPIQKVVNKNTNVKIDCSTHYNSSTGPWGLGVVDAFYLANVHVGSTAGTMFDETNPDRKDWFYLDSGQTDDIYKHSKLIVKPQYASSLDATSTLLVKFHHFTANVTASQAGFFSVDSYPIDDINTSNTQAIQTAQIPVYSSVSGINYDLRNHIDFRPVFANTATYSTTAAGATINPANNSTTLVVGTGNPIAIEPNANFNYNVEYYLPRVDNLILNKDGALDVKQGTPAVNPVAPAINTSGLKLADIYVPPYPSLTFIEAE